MAKEKVLIAVKTYPVLSENYTELACTAGFREDGTWIRLYPIPFRLLDGSKRYEKYQWVEVDVAPRNNKDPRPESHRVLNVDGMTLLDTVGTGKNRDWAERRRLILSRNRIYTNKREIIAKAHANELSLVIFKPAKIVDFVIEKADPEWPPEKLQALEEKLKQGALFEDQKLADFKPVRKLPFKFSYRFLDDEGKESTLMIEDWEIGALYWNCAKDNSPEKAAETVREKYMGELATSRDLYLFLGTTREWHIRKSPNPFVIVGTFYPPHETQTSLL